MLHILTLLSNRDRRRSQAGFTLVEIMIVVVIIGLLGSLVVPRLFKNVEKAKVRTAQEQIRNIGLALNMYRLDVGEYPGNLDALISGGGEGWDGPYIKKIPKDPWGGEYSYSLMSGGDD
ncbi:type II secretion system major pseudopilin GspG, partial [bacterium]|nr:type II secretion system major pseudopilin GspG [candidate division CSSED10-310 bacterium]